MTNATDPQHPLRRAGTIGAMRPMLATPTATPGVPPHGPEWVHEVKWDGVRALAETHGGSLSIFNRSERDTTPAYPDIVAGAHGLPDGLLFDGEIIAIDPVSGVPTLHGIAPRIHVRDADRAERLSLERPATFMAFDLLRIGDRDLTPLPLRERRRLLEEIDHQRPSWRLSETYDDPEPLSRFTRNQGLEGVISKRISSRYQPGVRSTDWIKTPHRTELVAVIGGWIPETGDDRRLGSLWVGHATEEATFDQDPVLYPLGRVGSGLNHRDRDTLLAVLRGIERTDPPFDPVPSGPEAQRTHWVEPMICAQVRYLTTTSAGLMRQPVLRALRPDVKPVDAATADTRLIP